jgi:hypothetical protein
MDTVKRDDIVRLFPGIQDHTILAILETRPPLEDVEAAALLLASADEGSIGIRQREGDRINRLLAILGSSEVRPLDEGDF